MGSMTTVKRVVPFCCLLLAACASKPVEVKPELTFPTPLVEPVPVKLAVYYPAAFKDYVFENLPAKALEKERKAKEKEKAKAKAKNKEQNETAAAQQPAAATKPAKPKPAKAKSRSKKKQPVGQGLKIALGTAQTPLLSNVLKAQFASVQLHEQREIGDADLLLQPEVVEFQYSSPKLTKLKVYEVWIKYRFNFYDRDDEAVMRWVVPVYGKTPTAFLKSDAEAFEAAAEVALRDLGAAFVTGLPRQAAFQQWLEERGQ